MKSDTQPKAPGAVDTQARLDNLEAAVRYLSVMSGHEDAGMTVSKILTLPGPSHPEPAPTSVFDGIDMKQLQVDSHAKWIQELQQAVVALAESLDNNAPAINGPTYPQVVKKILRIVTDSPSPSSQTRDEQPAKVEQPIAPLPGRAAYYEPCGNCGHPRGKHLGDGYCEVTHRRADGKTYSCGCTCFKPDAPASAQPASATPASYFETHPIPMDTAPSQPPQKTGETGNGIGPAILKNPSAIPVLSAEERERNTERASSPKPDVARAGAWLPNDVSSAGSVAYALWGIGAKMSQDDIRRALDIRDSLWRAELDSLRSANELAMQCAAAWHTEKASLRSEVTRLTSELERVTKAGGA